MKQTEESGYKHLGIIQDSEIKNHVMKDKIRTEYLRRVRNCVYGDEPAGVRCGKV